jgi:hypothetical protein
MDKLFADTVSYRVGLTASHLPSWPNKMDKLFAGTVSHHVRQTASHLPSWPNKMDKLFADTAPHHVGQTASHLPSWPNKMGKFWRKRQRRGWLGVWKGYPVLEGVGAPCVCGVRCMLWGCRCMQRIFSKVRGGILCTCMFICVCT